MRAALILVALVFAGCASPAPVATPTTAPPVSEPSWRDAARTFDVPAGDSFGILLRNFTQEENLGGGTYGLTMDTTALGKDSYAELSAYAIQGAEATWKGVNFLLDGGVRSARISSPSALFVIVVHAEKAGRIRIGDENSAGRVRDEQVPGTFLVSGPAEFSYLLAYGHVGADRVETRTISHGVTSDGNGVPPGSFATAGTPSATSKHAGGAVTIEFAYFQSYPEYGAGQVTTSWTANGKTTTSATRYASPADIAETIVAGPAIGATTATISETGGGALPQFWLHHSSVPFDLASVGLHETPQSIQRPSAIG